MELATMKLIKALSLLLLCATAHAGVHVYFTNPGTPQTITLQNQLMAMVTTYYQAVETSSSAAANTYTFTVSGQKAVPGGLTVLPCQLDLDIVNMVSISSQTGYYMFGSGEAYQNKVVEGITVGQGNLCGSATSFNLIQSSTKTFDKATCMDTINTLLIQFFELNLSTPTPLPVEP